MTAEEMFESLRWEKINYIDGFGDTDYIAYQRKENSFNHTITFDFKDHTVVHITDMKEAENSTYLIFHIPLLKAIRKQIEELGW